MQVLYWIITALLILACLMLIVSIVMQSGKSAGLSGSIGGGAEQLFGRQKGRSLDSLFERLTKISATVFMVSAVLLVILQKFL